MGMIPLAEYAKRLGRDRSTCYMKYRRGGFKTAVKRGRDIWIDENEPYVDDRIITGKYVGFHQGYRAWKDIQKARKGAAPATDKE